MTDNEYSDSIENFVNTKSQNGPVNVPSIDFSQTVSRQNDCNNITSDQLNDVMQQQQAMQQQAAMQQQMLHQQMMQQQMVQKQMMQQEPVQLKDNLSIFEKLKKLNNNDVLQEIFIIAILFIILSTDFYKSNIINLPFVQSEGSGLNTAGLLISSILIGVVFVIIRVLL